MQKGLYRPNCSYLSGQIRCWLFTSWWVGLGPWAWLSRVGSGQLKVTHVQLRDYIA